MRLRIHLTGCLPDKYSRGKPVILEPETVVFFSLEHSRLTSQDYLQPAPVPVTLKSKTVVPCMFIVSKPGLSSSDIPNCVMTPSHLVAFSYDIISFVILNFA